MRNEIKQLKPYSSPEILEAEVKLNQNESPYNLPKEIIEQIIKRISKVEFNRYNEGSSKKLRELIAKKFNVKKEQIIVGAGIDELLYYLMLVYIDKGDKVVRHVPSFSMYEICSKISGAEDTPVFLDNNFKLSEEFVNECKDAKVVFICRPNNPTSNSFNKKTIEKIINETKGIVCIDEAYAEFSGEDCLEFLKYKNVVIMRTFSKAYSAAAVRLGYAIADEEIINAMNKVKLPWNVSIFSQIAGEILLENDEIFTENVKEIKENREEFISEMKKIVKVVSTDCNFILFEVSNPNKIFRKLMKNGILIRDVSNYPLLKNYLRVNVGTKKENQRFVETLREILKPIDAIIFDIDGVLIDTSESYNEAIIRTVKEFLGKNISNKEIDELKAISGFNNDWDCVYALCKNIREPLEEKERNLEEYKQMKEFFQKIYLEELIKKEKPLINVEILKILKSKNYKLGIVTGRPREEALFALRKAGISPKYIEEKDIIALEDCDEEKPSAKPLILAKENLNANNPVYVGDTKSDKIASMNAKMEFIFCGKEIENINKILEVLK